MRQPWIFQGTIAYSLCNRQRSKRARMTRFQAATAVLTAGLIGPAAAGLPAALVSRCTRTGRRRAAAPGRA